MSYEKNIKSGLPSFQMYFHSLIIQHFVPASCWRPPTRLMQPEFVNGDNKPLPLALSPYTGVEKPFLLFLLFQLIWLHDEFI